MGNLTGFIGDQAISKLEACGEVEGWKPPDKSLEKVGVWQKACSST